MLCLSVKNRENAKARRTTGSSRFRGFAVFYLAIGLLLTGCSSGRMNTPMVQMKQGDWNAALTQVREEIPERSDKGDRRWMLARMRAGVLACDSGQWEEAEGHLADCFDIFRTQGLNADRTVPAVLTTEGVRIWKGEPFEQALMLTYYGLDQATLQSWDNTRAAAANALFALRDADTPAADNGRNGYLPVATNYVSGHLLHALASSHMGRQQEVEDQLSQVEKLRPDLLSICRRIRKGDFDSVLVVADGLGPQLERLPRTPELTHYVPRTYAQGSLHIRTANGAQNAPAVCDLNAMARDHRWRDFEQVRRAKANVGRGLQTAGAFTTLAGAHHDNSAAVLIGLGMLAAGAITEATSKARLDYCDVFPQRLFIVPLKLEDAASVTVQLGVQQATLPVPEKRGPHPRLIYHRFAP